MNYCISGNVSLCVIRQLMESSHEGQSVAERIYQHVRGNADWNTRPENGQPDEALKVEFGLSVLCAELDEFNRQLTTYVWQLMVRKTNGKYDE